MSTLDLPFPPLRLPSGITESYVPTSDLKYHILSAGKQSDPLILLQHGFPDLAYSWRKILLPLSDLGYYVVAYDQRGYGRTTGWDTRSYEDVDLGQWSMTRIVTDALRLVRALGKTEVEMLVGHDFGGVSAGMCGLMRPDVFKSIFLMSHPYKGSPSFPLEPAEPLAKSSKDRTHEDLANLPADQGGPRKHYKWYFACPEAASELLNPTSGLHTFLRGYFHLKSGDWGGNAPHPLTAWNAKELSKLPYYYVMPLDLGMRETVALDMQTEDEHNVEEKSSAWLPDDELAVYVDEFTRTGFQGMLNWYRVATMPGGMKEVELFSDMKLNVPMMFLSGDKDWGMYQAPGVLERMSDNCESGMYRGTAIVRGSGHWVMQENPEEVLHYLKEFLGSKDDQSKK